MQRSWFATLLHGMAGGLVAGVVVAAWFFVVDIATTEPFLTPSRLASVILGEEFRWPTVRLVAVYSVLHFGVFALLGVATAWFLQMVDAAPGVLVGVVFGVGVLNAVHYGGLLMTGGDLLTVLPVGHVLAANLLGGMLMMAYLHRATRATAPFGIGVLARQEFLQRGLATGLVGAGAVALWFLVVDILTSVPFATPAALGSAILLGVSGPGEVQLDLAVVGAYTIVHVAAFCVVGVLLTAVVERIERAPAFWLVALMGFIVLEALFVAAVGILGGWVLGVLGWIQVGVGNLVAVVTMGTWLWKSHPDLRARLGGEPLATRV